MTQMTARFQRCRWGIVRKLIDQIPPGGYATFHQTRYNTVITTARRLEDAYGDRTFAVTKSGDYYVVARAQTKTNNESKTKITESMLYECCLDLWYASKLYEGVISDTAEQLKIVKQAKRKTDKLLAKAKEQYEQSHGKPPVFNHLK